VTWEFPQPEAALIIDVHDRMVHNTSEVHGLVDFPTGYTLQVVPVSATVNPIHPASDNLGSRRTNNPTHEKPRTINLSKTLNPLKSIAAIAQLIAAVYVLWKARGKQLDTYGYAAYSLTVIPYALLSLLNLLVSLAIPEYPMLYLVRNTFLDKLEGEGHIFEGIVGKLEISMAATELQANQALSSTSSQQKSSEERELATFQIPTIQQEQSVQECISSDQARQSEAFLDLLDSKISVTSIVTLSTIDGQSVATCTTDGASKLTVKFKISGETSKPSADIYLEPCGKFRSWTTVCGELWPRVNTKLFPILCMSIFYVLLAIPYAVVFGLTGFAQQQSTVLQRTCLMLWFVLQIYGDMLSQGVNDAFQKRHVLPIGGWIGIMWWVVTLPVVGIGMFIIVWMMILDSEVCTVI